MSPTFSFEKLVPLSPTLPLIGPEFSLRSQSTDHACAATALLNAWDALDPAAKAPAAEEFIIWQSGHCKHMGDGEPGCVHYGLMQEALKRGFSVAAHYDDMTCIDDAMEDLVMLRSQLPSYHARVSAQKGEVIKCGGEFQCGLLDIAVFKQMEYAGQKGILLIRDPSAIEHWVGVERRGDKIALLDPHPWNRTYYRTHMGTETPELTISELNDISTFCAESRSSHMLIKVGHKPP